MAVLNKFGWSSGLTSVRGLPSTRVPMLHGESAPPFLSPVAKKPAPFTKLAGLRGIDAKTVRWNVTERLPTVATTVTAPGVAPPAVAMTCASPPPSVVALAPVNEAGPVTAYYRRGFEKGRTR